MNLKKAIRINITVTIIFTMPLVGIKPMMPPSHKGYSTKLSNKAKPIGESNYQSFSKKACEL